MEVMKKYKIAVVSNLQLALGFKLVGIAEAYSSDNPLEQEKIIKELMQRDDIGLIIMTSGIIKNIKDRKLSNAVSDSVLPMIIEVPDYNEEGEPDTLRRLILRAIGIDISKMNINKNI
jgi:vacuolar-type H+-ATPase subunit F/Vma7